MSGNGETSKMDDEKFLKLYIGGLTSSTTNDIIKEHFSKWGTLTDCVVMKDSQSKKSRGFGFVSYQSPTMVDEAMVHRPHVIDGKEVEVKRAVPRESVNKPENHISVKKLYVNGIKEDHTEEMLKEHFSKFGTVSDVDIIKDKGTGKKRGFAFVQFNDYDPVDKCVLLRSHVINDKRCDVKKALSRDEMRKAEQQERERLEREMRSRGSARGWGLDYGHYGGYSTASAGHWEQQDSSSYGAYGYGGYTGFSGRPPVAYQGPAGYADRNGWARNADWNQPVVGGYYGGGGWQNQAADNYGRYW